MRNYLVLPALCATAAVVLIASGATSAHDGKDKSDIGRCVSAPIDDSKIIDDKTLLLTDDYGDAVILKMTSACLSDRFHAVGIRMRGTSQICDPVDADITGGVGGGVPYPCNVASVTPISRDAARDLMNASAKN